MTNPLKYYTEELQKIKCVPAVNARLYGEYNTEFLQLAGCDKQNPAYIPLFVELIKKVSQGLPDIHEYADFLRVVNDRLHEIYPNNKTVNTQSVALRKAIAEIFGKSSEYNRLSYELIGLTNEQRDKIDVEYARKLNADLRDRGDMLPFSEKLIRGLIFAPFPFYTRFINKNYFYDVIISLMLATGCRLSEVFTARFEITEIKDTNRAYPAIYLSNLAKNSQDCIRRLNYLSAEQFADLYTYISNKSNWKFNPIVNKRCSPQLISGITEYLYKLQQQGIIDGMKISSHKLRYIASELNYRLFGGSAEETTYKSEYYGHNSYSSVQPYLRIMLRFD